MGIPSYYSRYRFCTAYPDQRGRLYFSAPEPFAYVDLPDNRTHTTIASDTWESLADKFFRALTKQLGLLDMEPSHLWWVLCDFQPDPQPDAAFDPTIRLSPGTKLVIPSVATVIERIFSEKRRPDFEA